MMSLLQIFIVYLVVSLNFHLTICYSGIQDYTSSMFQVGKPDACNSTFTNQTFGIITSPFYPLGYPNSTNCRWVIRMAKDERIVVTIKNFVLGIKDQLIVEDEDSKKVYSLGYPPNNVIYSKGNVLVIELMSGNLYEPVARDVLDALQRNNSFYAEFEKEGCGGFITKESGYITVPSYIFMSHASHECAWTILSPINKVIVLQFLQFDLPPGSCLYSNIYIREGDQSGGYVLGDFCEENPPLNQLRTATNIMYIAYRTRPNLLTAALDINPMVKMFYKIVDTCGGVLNGFSGSFATPRRWMDDRYTCNWTITIPQEKQLLIKFDSWKVSNTTETEYDELRLIIPNTNYIYWSSKGDIVPPDSFIIPSNQLIISLQSFRNKTASVKLHLHGIYQAINQHDKQCIDVGHKSLFMCDEWRYIDCALRCDGIIDCENGVDERFCPITSLDTIVMQHLQHREQKKSPAGFVFYILLGLLLVVLAATLTLSRACYHKKLKTPQHRADFHPSYPLPPPYTALTNNSTATVSTPPPPYVELENGQNTAQHARKKQRSFRPIQQTKTRLSKKNNVNSQDYDFATPNSSTNGERTSQAELKYFNDNKREKLNIRRKAAPMSPRSLRRKNMSKFKLGMSNVTEENTVLESTKNSTHDTTKSLTSEASFANGKLKSKDSSSELRLADIHRTSPQLEELIKTPIDEKYLTKQNDFLSPIRTPSEEFSSSSSSDFHEDDKESESTVPTNNFDEESTETTDLFHNTDILDPSSDLYSTPSLDSTHSLGSVHNISRESILSIYSDQSNNVFEDNNLTKITSPSASTWSRDVSMVIDSPRSSISSPDFSNHDMTPDVNYYSDLSPDVSISKTMSPDTLDDIDDIHDELDDIHDEIDDIHDEIDDTHISGQSIDSLEPSKVTMKEVSPAAFEDETSKEVLKEVSPDAFENKKE